MGIFDNMLKEGESLFVDEIALDYDYMPKLVKYRENQQHYIADCIKPLFNNRNGRNLFICGKPGIGKTLVVKHVLRDLKNETDTIIPIYINCWKKDTSFKIVNEICEQLNYKWTQGKRTDELMEVITNMLNKKSVVFCLDEADKVKEVDVIYSLCEDILKKSIIMITNEKDWYSNLDGRIRSRLMCDYLEFKPYNFKETEGILKERMNHAFVQNIFDEEGFNMIVKKAYEVNDIRTGLFLMKEAGNLAESRASRDIKIDHVKIAILKLESFKVKSSADFGEEERKILDIIKENSGKTTKELFDIYSKDGGDKSYRTFFRRIEDLKRGKMIETEEINEGFAGRATKVSYTKKLDEF